MPRAIAPRTVVIQSFRTTGVPDWVERCLASVGKWAAAKGYEYCFYGDEIFDLCGADYVSRIDGNLRSITNLARLEATKLKLAAGYQQVIWLDADIFIFDPARFSMETQAPYAFGREAWVEAHWNRTARLVKRGMHNAAFIFTQRQTDLDLFIQIIRHAVTHRKITSNFQVGIDVISGLANTLGIASIDNVGMFSPYVIKALARNRTFFLRDFARFHGHKMQAANMGYSLNTEGDTMLKKAMDRLEDSAGEIVNAHLAPRGLNAWPAKIAAFKSSLGMSA